MLLSITGNRRQGQDENEEKMNSDFGHEVSPVSNGFDEVALYGYIAPALNVEALLPMQEA